MIAAPSPEHLLRTEEPFRLTFERANAAAARFHAMTNAVQPWPSEREFDALESAYLDTRAALHAAVEARLGVSADSLGRLL